MGGLCGYALLGVGFAAEMIGGARLSKRGQAVLQTHEPRAALADSSPLTSA